MAQLHTIGFGPSKAPPLLFLHGFLGSAREWEETMTFFKSRYHCLAVDLPGHGAAPRTWTPDAYTADGAGEAVMEVLQKAQIGKCTLIGYSMGGRLALHLALRYPECFSGLVLESASPGIEEPQERAQRRATDESWALQLEQNLESFLVSWYQQPLFDSLHRDPSLFHRILDARRANSPAELARSLRGMGTGVQRSVWQELPGLKVPLLMVVGSLDARYRELGNRVVQICPSARLAVVPEAGHNVHQERTQEYARIVERFLNREDQKDHGKD